MNKIQLISFSLVFLLIFGLAKVTWAGSSTNYALEWQVFSNGGAAAMANFGHVKLNSSVGQNVIGISTSTGNDHLQAGYWAGQAIKQTTVYLPVIMREF